MLKRDKNQAQGNTKARSDFRSATLTSLAALKAAFDKVMALLPETYAFGTRGHTNVTQTLIEQAIKEFMTLTSGNFPSLTIDNRSALILALRKLEVARATWKTARTKKK